MILYLTAFVAFGFFLVSSINPVNVQNLIYLIPGSETRMTPFRLQSDMNDSVNSIYNLLIICSDSVQEGVGFLQNQSNFCQNGHFRGSILEINQFLETLKATIININSKSLKISYKLLNDQGIEIFAIDQHMSVLDKIPISLFTNIAKFESDESKSENKVAILAVDQDYLSSFDRNNLSFLGKNLSNFVFSFQQNILYLKLSDNQHSLLPNTIEFNIYDAVTKFSSDKISIRIIGASDIFLPISKKNLVFGAVIFAIVLTCLVIIIYCIRQKLKSGANARENINSKNLAMRNNSSGISGESPQVLTHSIVTWNKKLIEMHKKKTTLESQEDTNLIILNRDKMKEFDDSNRPEEFARDHSGKHRPFEDISEINTESMDLKEPASGCGNSSFLEDFNL